MMLLYLSWKNLWRNKRRTLLSGLTLVLGTIFLIITLDLYDYLLYTSLEESAGKFVGHGRVVRKGYLENYRLSLTLDSLPYKFRSSALVEAYSPRFRVFALAASKDESRGVEVLGIDIKRDTFITHIERYIVKGRYISSEGTLIGEDLANTLGLSVGDTLYLIGVRSDGSMFAEGFIIEGIFKTGIFQRDANTVIMSKENVKNLADIKGEAHEYIFRLKKPLKALEFKGILTLPKEYEVVVWQEEMKSIWDILRLWNAYKVIVGVIFYFAVVLIVLNAILVAFYERRKEFAILLAMGMKRYKLFLTVLCESLFLGILSIGISVPLTLIVGFILHHHPIDLRAYMSTVRFENVYILPVFSVQLNPINYIISSILLLVLVMMVSLFVSSGIYRIDVPRLIRERGLI